MCSLTAIVKKSSVVVGIIEVQMGDLPDTKQYISVMASVGVTCLRYGLQDSDPPRISEEKQLTDVSNRAISYPLATRWRGCTIGFYSAFQ